MNQYLEMYLKFYSTDGIPSVGDSNRADLVIIPAFGRNSVSDKDVYTIGSLGEHFSNGKALNLLANGGHHVRKINIGTPNSDLAKECKEIMDTYGIPAIVQWEIALALYKNYIEWYIRNEDKIYIIWPPIHFQIGFSTFDFVQKASEVMQKKSFSTPIALAHKAMIIRVFLIMRKLLGKDPIVPEQKTGSWDKSSVQWQTRSKWLWIAREFPTRVHHILTRRV